METAVENTTRQKLIEKASDLIERKGYFGTGINEILKETGIPKGSLYHFFPGGKDDLLKEAIKFSSKRQQKAYSEAMLGKTSLEEGLKAVLDYLINLLETSDYQYACPITAIALESLHGKEVIKEACRFSYTKTEKNFEAYLNLHGVENADKKARVIINMIEGALILAKINANTGHLESLKPYLKKVLYD